MWEDFQNITQMYTNETRWNYYSRCSTVAATSACPGDAVFRCESESTLFGLPKEDTTSCCRLYFSAVTYFQQKRNIE